MKTSSFAARRTSGHRTSGASQRLAPSSAGSLNRPLLRQGAAHLAWTPSARRGQLLTGFLATGLLAGLFAAPSAQAAAPVVKDLELPTRIGSRILARLEFSDADGDALTATPQGAVGTVGAIDSRGFFLYTPPANGAAFVDDFTVDVSDGTTTTTATVTFDVASYSAGTPFYSAVGASDVQGYGASDYGATFSNGSYDEVSFSPALAYAPQVASPSKLGSNVPGVVLSRRAINGLTLADAFGVGGANNTIALAASDGAAAYSIAFGPNDVLYQLLPLMLSNPANTSNPAILDAIVTGYLNQWRPGYTNINTVIAGANPNAKFAAITVPDLGPGLTAAFGGALAPGQKANLSAALTSACTQMTTHIKTTFPAMVDLQGNTDLNLPADAALVLNPGTDLFVDGFHPSDSGYSKLATRLTRLLNAQINAAPTAITLSNNTVKEDQPVGTFVGQLTTTDPDAGDSFTYSLVAGDAAEFSIDGRILRTDNVYDASFQSSFNITVRTTDSEGLFFDQAFTINVLETTKPVVAITAPAANAKILLPSFTPGSITGTTSDNIGVASVRVRLSRKVGNVNQYWNGTDFVAAQSTVLADLNGANWTLTTNAPPVAKLTAGVYSIQAAAYDAAGNRSDYANRSFTLQGDLIAPTVIINTPTQNAVVDINSLTANALNGGATDNTGVVSVKLKLQRKRGAVTQYWNGTEFTNAVATFDATLSEIGDTNVGWGLTEAIPASQLDRGGYTLYATAYDAAGNFKTSPSRIFTITGTPAAPDASSEASSSANRS